MGLFGSKDWNVIAIIFEKHDLYRVNGNRGKGKEADAVRDGAKMHSRTIYWVVFDQKGGFLEADTGPGKDIIPPATLKRLIQEIPLNKTVRDILKTLEKGETAKSIESPGLARLSGQRDVSRCGPDESGGGDFRKRFNFAASSADSFSTLTSICIDFDNRMGFTKQDAS